MGVKARGDRRGASEPDSRRVAARSSRSGLTLAAVTVRANRPLIRAAGSESSDWDEEEEDKEDKGEKMKCEEDVPDKKRLEL